jgi:hypothetical protein
LVTETLYVPASPRVMVSNASDTEMSLEGTAETGTAISLLEVSGSKFLSEVSETNADPFTNGPVAETSRRRGMVTTRGSPPTEPEAKEPTVQATVFALTVRQSAGSKVSTIELPVGAVK